MSNNDLTAAQNELLEWIKDYIKTFYHSPSIRQMMSGMGLKSPAPIQSRLKHLQEKGYISWQEGKARTLQLIDEISNSIPILGSVAAGGLIETFADVSQSIDFSNILFYQKNRIVMPFPHRSKEPCFAFCSSCFLLQIQRGDCF